MVPLASSGRCVGLSPAPRFVAAALALVLAAQLAGSSSARAATFQPPPAPAQRVTDQAAFLSAPARAALEARLARYERDTGHQVIVWIGRDTGGVPLEEWTARTFEAWGIGKKGKDDGLALFVFADERKLRIEVGYGLEGVVPDAVAHRVIDEEALPRLREGRSDAAVGAAVNALLRTVGGERAPPEGVSGGQERYERRPPVALTWPQKIGLGIAGLLLLALFITHPQLALFLLYSLLSGRHGGGGLGGGGGGGFRGGGGRSGGGGASGSW